MSVIEWSNTYLLGIEQIDEHHRHLIDLLDTTYNVFVSHGQKVEVGKVLEALIDYAIYHFAAEERLMAQYDYSRAADHLEQHEDFVKRVKTQQREFHDGRGTLSLELIVFIKEWLLDHILETDRHLANAIKAKRGNVRR